MSSTRIPLWIREFTQKFKKATNLLFMKEFAGSSLLWFFFLKAGQSQLFEYTVF